jgi:sugar phosphate isomerase/epimerase
MSGTSKAKTNMQYGYCGNVHPGTTIEEIKRNLSEHALAVKAAVCPNAPLPFGLWLSNTAARELDDWDTLEQFRDWLNEHGLVPFTFNGFPFGDFHQDVVKHSVYLPTWADQARLTHTMRLADIQNVLLPEGQSASISTLPLGWPSRPASAGDAQFLETCAANLREMARHLATIADSSGREIILCIEPEPGCVLDTCDDMTDFFQRHLLTGDHREDETTLRHIGVCHDICHSAVMFEDQSTAMKAYRNSGIRVGKVQVSSAIAVDFSNRSDDEIGTMIRQLESFVEPRYLHQTSVRVGGETTFYEDLPQAIQAVSGQPGGEPTGEWRVHFHVPIFSETLGLIGTSQSEIAACLDSMKLLGVECAHFEIETYAWNVLPAEWRTGNLADGIAEELRWFEGQSSRTS